MVALALALALAVTPDDALARDDAPAPRAPRAATANRPKRFLGALAGGAVGFGLPLVLLPVADQSCSAPRFAGPCQLTGHALIAGSAIVLSLVGALAGQALVNGGETSFGAGVAGSLLGLVLGMGLLAATHVAVLRNGGEPGLAPSIAAAALLVSAQAFALTSRAEALDEDPDLVIDGLRFLLEAGTFVLAAALAGGLTLLASAITTGSGCWRNNTCAVLPMTVGVVAGALVPLATWGAHRAKGGEGSLGVAYLATVATAGVGLLAGLLTSLPLAATGFAPTTDLNRTTIAAGAGAVVGGVLLAVFSVPLALEVSHQVNQARPRLSVGAAPIAGGAVGLLGATF